MTIPGKTWKDQKRKRQGRKVRTQLSNKRLNELAEERVAETPRLGRRGHVGRCPPDEVGRRPVTSGEKGGRDA